MEELQIITERVDDVHVSENQNFCKNNSWKQIASILTKIDSDTWTDERQTKFFYSPEAIFS